MGGAKPAGGAKPPYPRREFQGAERGARPEGARPTGGAKPEGGAKPPYPRREFQGSEKGARPARAPAAGAAPRGAAKGKPARAWNKGTGPGGERKPWEFKQKGMTLRSELRRKIRAAKASKRKPR